MNWLLVMSWPHSWRQDCVLQFDTEEEAREYVSNWPHPLGKFGQENYCRIKLAQIVEELN